MPRIQQSLSENDRIFLLEAAGNSRGLLNFDFWPLLVWILIGTLIYAGLALAVLGIAARLAGYPIAGGAWRENPVTYIGAITTVSIVFATHTLSTVRWEIGARRQRTKRRNAILGDLKNGLVMVETMTVEGVKLLQEQQHFTFIFLLRLSNGKTLVLYDYGSYDDENDRPEAARPTVTVRDNITLRSFPLSKRKRWDFEGSEVPLPSPIELVLDPGKWPEDEAWCRVKWENIDRHYGPKPVR